MDCRSIENMASFKEIINKIDLWSTAYDENGYPCEVCMSIRFWSLVAFSTSAAINISLFLYLVYLIKNV